MNAALMTNDGTELRSDQTLDCRGQLCPMPIYKTRIAMSRLDPGQVLEVLCTDPGSLVDFPAYARQTGDELLETVRRDAHQAFFLRKRAA